MAGIFCHGILQRDVVISGVFACKGDTFFRGIKGELLHRGKSGHRHHKRDHERYGDEFDESFLLSHFSSSPLIIFTFVG